MTKNLHKCNIIGAAWGVVEATAGYFLHLFAAGIGWMFWFPIAFCFIHMSYQYTKSYSSVMLTAIIAASLKLVDLFFPVRIDMVVNPAVSIILEALAAVLIYHFVLNRKADRMNILSVLLVGFLWRAFYICYVMFLPQNLIDLSPAASTITFCKFMFMNNVINALCISGGLWIAKKTKQIVNKVFVIIENLLSRNKAMKPALTALSVIMAITVQILF